MKCIITSKIHVSLSVMPFGRTVLVAIVSQNSFVLDFFLNGVSHDYRAIRCKKGYRTSVSV